MLKVGLLLSFQRHFLVEVGLLDQLSFTRLVN